MLAALATLVLCGVVLSGTIRAVDDRPQKDPEHTDIFLYRRIAERVAGGDSYYAAATREQRQRNYPLRPFVTVRLPTLATLQATIGFDAAAPVLTALAAVAGLAMMRRLAQDHGPGGVRLAASTLLALGLAPFAVPVFAAFHEAWASILIVLSLACRSRERWVLSVLIGLAAAAFREFAAPYLCLMALTALLEGNRREAMAWAAAVAAFALALALHAAAVAPLVTAQDPASPGWGVVGGWSFILVMVSECTLLITLGALCAALVVPFCLLGWAAWPGSLGLRGALLLVGLTGTFMLIGRPDNSYWGLMMTPLLFVGLAHAPSAMRDLLAASARPVRAAPRAA